MSRPPTRQPPLRFERPPGSVPARSPARPRRPVGSRPRPRARRWRLPLWLRWALSLSIAAALIVLLISYVNGHSADTPTFASPQAEVTANREAAILIREDQAPHSVPLPAGATPATALRAAVQVDMNRLIARNVIYGPLKSVSCQAVGAPGARQAFRCRALANGVYYPFLGVVDSATARITYCKSDPPPVPSMRIPVSPLCR